jgi:radical SAM superfamily enzyme YgiQ (UPF0313 family)
MERPAGLPTSAPPPRVSVGFDLESVRARMAGKLRSIPTAFVMTRDTLEAIKEQASKHEPGVTQPKSLDFIYGIPFETYHTIEECLVRMSSQKDGERLQLISDLKPTVSLENP